LSGFNSYFIVFFYPASFSHPAKSSFPAYNIGPADILKFLFSYMRDDDFRLAIIKFANSNSSGGRPFMSNFQRNAFSNSSILSAVPVRASQGIC
jgi:hypothetical protein